MPANAAPRAFSRRLRRCFLVRTALPEGRAPFAAGPERDAVVRTPRPAGGRPPRPAGGRPPPPLPPAVRPDGGRRTEPLRGPTGEVSSWGGTQGPSLVRVSVGAQDVTRPAPRVASSAARARTTRGARTPRCINDHAGPSVFPV